MPGPIFLGGNSKSKLIEGNVIHFRNRVQHTEGALSSFTMDREKAVVGAIVTSHFNSALNPNFEGLEGIDYVIGAWEASEDLLLVFRFFDDKCFLNVSNSSATVEPEDTRLLFITSPTPRTEIHQGIILDISAIGENATAVLFQYLNVAGDWVDIGNGTETGLSTGIFNYQGWSPIVSATAIQTIATYSDGTTQTVQNILYSFSYVANFNAPNGTLLENYVADEVLGGTGLIPISGDWEIQNNTLGVAPGDTGIHPALKDIGTSSAIMRFNCTLDSSSNTIFVFRYIDADNYGMILLNANGRLSIAKREPGNNVTILQAVDGYYTSGTLLEMWLTDNSITIIKNNLPNIKQEFTDFPTGTSYGILRGGADYRMAIRSFTVLPISLDPIDTTYSFTVTKSNNFLIEKGGFSPYDDRGVAGPDIFDIGDTRYFTFAMRDNLGQFFYLSYATAPTSDPYSLTRHNTLVLDTTNDDLAISNSSGLWDGTNLHIAYGNRDNAYPTAGQIFVASGPDINSLVKNPIPILNLTVSHGIYSRHGSIGFHNGKYYMFFDSRRDQSSGEFGELWCVSGPSLTSLSNPREILSTPGYSFEQTDLTSPSFPVYDTVTRLWTIYYSGYRGGGIPYFHEGGAAVCETIDGKYRRISTTPIIPLGPTGSIDDRHVHDLIVDPADHTEVIYAANNAVDDGGTVDTYDGFVRAKIVRNP